MPMPRFVRRPTPIAIAIAALAAVIWIGWPDPNDAGATAGATTVHRAVARDVSPPLASIDAPSDGPRQRVSLAAGTLAPPEDDDPTQQSVEPYTPKPGPVPGAAIEQTTMGMRPAAALVASFDGLGHGFEGPQGPSTARNPSDNSLAVGPDHIVQTVNSRLAIFTKKGARFDTTGRVLYGAVPTHTIFHGFGGACEARNNGDAVVRYDQLAGRWLVVMPLFRRSEARLGQPDVWQAGPEAKTSPPSWRGQPGGAAPLFVPPPAPPPEPPARGQGGGQRARGANAITPLGPYGMCYAVSVGPDPLGAYYRYEFMRPLFPDYPRPAIWPDGYYVPTSTGDNVIQKHACVVDRNRMLRGEPATEQCIVIDGVNFLNNADIDGTGVPPAGAPNVMMATGGTQLKDVLEDDVVYAWAFQVDWDDPSKTRVTGPTAIPVAPYRYLCGGQLTSCVPQPDDERRLDAQGD